MLKKFLPLVKGYGLRAILCSLFVACETVCEVFIPFLMKDIVDVGIPAGDMPYILRTGLYMVLLSLLALAFGALSGRYAAVASTGFARNVRQRLFHSLQDYSFANIDRFSTASLITRLTVDVTNTQNAFMMIIRMLVRAPVMLVAASIMAVRINGELAMIFLFALPVLAIALYTIARIAFPRFSQMLDKYDALNAAIQEKLTGIRLVKAFVREDHEKESFREAATTLQRYQMRAERVLIINMPIMMFTMYSCIIAVFWLGGQQIIIGDMQAGELFSFISYISQILMSLMMISMVFISLVLSRASLGRIIECLDEVPEIRDNALLPGESAPQMEDGSVEFRHVDFSYSKNPNNLNLHDLNLRIESGMTVGILGGTGSAKTTLVQLIPRLYDVTAGQLLVGGHDVREYRLNDLRNNVAMVLQNNLLFSGTIEENLRWGNAEATQEEIEQACRAAQAHDFILSFPKGYQTELGQAGVNVSGGQKQRLCIARALLKRPKIIILDDSTSAVDTMTDAAIRSAFRREFRDTTAIIIAQRIASVMDADMIVVLEEGGIAACGSHAQLMESSPLYREVYESQQKGVA